ncbi:MAG TPA: helix-turn-helix domain-containing protein [Phycisphaerales bacterium]|nr:helix-turn-helix domain-containing protein [Phycisphaerales bacterium]
MNNTEAPTTTAPLLVDRREAGRLLGVSPGTIDNLRTRGELPSVKLLSRRLFDVADLRRYIEARKGVGQ